MKGRLRLSRCAVAACALAFPSCAGSGESELVDAGIPAELLCGAEGELTFADLHEQVIAPACAICHHEGAMGTAPDMPSPDVGFESIRDVVSTRYAGTDGALKIVDPGAPHNSTMMLKVLGGSSAGYAGPGGEDVGGPMPQVGTLSTSQEDAILTWICAGADP